MPTYEVDLSRSRTETRTVREVARVVVEASSRDEAEDLAELLTGDAAELLDQVDWHDGGEILTASTPFAYAVEDVSRIGQSIYPDLWAGEIRRFVEATS